MEETRLAQAIAEGLSPYSIAEQLAALTTGYTPDFQSEQQEPTYYDRPVLKAPLWRWEIIWYFFFGGLSAGCYIIATIASLFGFGLVSGITATIQAARDGLLGRWWGARLLDAQPQKLIALPGTALGMFLGGY